MELDPSLTPYIKFILKWMQDKIVRAMTITLLGGNIGVNLHDLGLGNIVLNKTTKVQSTKEKQINEISSYYQESDKTAHRIENICKSCI